MDMATVQRDALAQVEAGAAVLDLNAGIPGFDEPAMLSAMVKTVHEVVGVPLCIDSSTPEALEAAVPLAQGQGADQLRHGRGSFARAAAAAGREIRRRGDRHGQRLRRHLDGSAGSPGGRAQDRGTRRRPRHRPRGRDHRPAYDADRRCARRGDLDVRDGEAAPLRAPRERELRRLEHLLRHAGPPWHRLGVPHDVDRDRHEHRHHEPAAHRDAQGDPRRRSAARARRVRRELDRAAPRRARGGERRSASRPHDQEGRGHVPAEREDRPRARGHDAVQRGALGRAADRVHVRRPRHVRQVRGEGALGSRGALARRLPPPERSARRGLAPLVPGGDHRGHRVRRAPPDEDAQGGHDGRRTLRAARAQRGQALPRAAAPVARGPSFPPRPCPRRRRRGRVQPQLRLGGPAEDRAGVPRRPRTSPRRWWGSTSSMWNPATPPIACSARRSTSARRRASARSSTCATGRRSAWRARSITRRRSAPT